MKRSMKWLFLGMVAVAAFSGCPLANTFFIHIDNQGNNIAITKIRLVNFETQEPVTGDLLQYDVPEGEQRTLLVSMDQVGTADMLRVTIEGTNPSNPLNFSTARKIDGGFAAGKTITVTVTGSPTQSVQVEIDPS